MTNLVALADTEVLTGATELLGLLLGDEGEIATDALAAEGCDVVMATLVVVAKLVGVELWLTGVEVVTGEDEALATELTGAETDAGVAEATGVVVALATELTGVETGDGAVAVLATVVVKLAVGELGVGIALVTGLVVAGN